MQTLTKNKYLEESEYAEFKRVIEEMLEENPNDPVLMEIASNFEIDSETADQ